MQHLDQAIDLHHKVLELINLRHRVLLYPTFLKMILESQFLAFTPNSNFTFSVGDIIVGSSTTARGTVSAYNDGRIFNFVISTAGSGYTGDFALTISAPMMRVEHKRLLQQTLLMDQ